MSPGTVTSRGRNLIGNIKQKFWTDKSRKNELPICSTPEQNNTQSDTFECSESEEYFVPLSHAAIGTSKFPKNEKYDATFRQQSRNRNCHSSRRE